MKSRLALVVALVVVALAAGLTTWRYVRVNDDISHTRSQLASTRESLLRASVALRSSQDQNATMQSQAARRARLLARLQGSLRSANRELQVALFSRSVPGPPYAPVMSAIAADLHHTAFAPKGAHVTRFRVVPAQGEDPAEIVVAWSRGVVYGDRPLEDGIYVWRGLPRHEPGSRLGWRVQFAIVLPLFHSLPAFISRTTTGWLPQVLSDWRAVRTYGDAGLYFLTGDATGDGYPEIMITDASGGSAGCAIYRILARSGQGLRQILYRNHCEGEIQPHEGMLSIDGAVWPKGCGHVHGCGHYESVLRWNGAGWDVISRHVRIDHETLRYCREHHGHC